MQIRTRALLVFLAVLFSSVGCDHASKQLAISTLTCTGSVSLAGDTLRLEVTSNPGAFLSVGAGLPKRIRALLFMGVVPLLVLWLCTQLLRGREAPMPFVAGLGLVAGGGLANWFDRLLHGGVVTDFITLGFGPLRTGVFNIADAAVVAGVLFVVFARRGGGVSGEAGRLTRRCS